MRGEREEGREERALSPEFAVKVVSGCAGSSLGSSAAFSADFP